MILGGVLAAPPIRLEHRLASVAAIVAELGRATGRDLRVGRELADEFLYVNLGPHPEGELMGWVAKAASAEWIGDGGTVSLGRSPSFVRRQAREDAASLGADLAGRLRPLLAPDDAVPWTGDHPLVNLRKRTTRPSDDDPWHRNATPGGRLLSRVLRALPPDELGGAPPGGTVRFALHPNRLQRPMTGTTEASVRQYAAERNALASELEALPDEETRFRTSFDFNLSPRSAEPRAVDGAMLSITRNFPGDVRFALYTTGSGLPELAAWLNLDESHRTFSLAQSLPGYAQWKDRPLVLGPVTASFVRSMNGAPDSGEAVRLRDPVAHEPLAALMADPLDRLAAAVGEEAIVAVPDETVTMAGGTLLQNPRLGGFADALAVSVAFESDGGTLIGKARRPSELARTKTDRTLLRDAIALVATGNPRLDATAAYTAAQNPASRFTFFESVAIEAAGFRLDPNGPFFRDRHALRVYAALSPAQRTALAGGASLPAGELSPRGREALAELAFDATGQKPEVYGPDGRLAAYDLDATLFADGLGPSARLSFEHRVEVPMLEWTRDGQTIFNDAEGMGQTLADQERFGYRPDLSTPDLAKTPFVPGAMRSFSVAVWPVPALCAQAFLSDLAFAPNAKPVRYRELPPAQLGPLMKTYEYYRKGSGEG